MWSKVHRVAWGPIEATDRMCSATHPVPLVSAACVRHDSTSEPWVSAARVCRAQNCYAQQRHGVVSRLRADTPEGGETAFPATTDEHWADIALKPGGLSRDCAEGHVAVKPEVGTALLFHSMPPGAETDEALRAVDRFSLHTGCPPAEGQLKWTATVWVHFDAFRPETFSEQVPKEPMPDPAVCRDSDPSCKMWAGARP